MVKCSFCDNLMNETDLNCPFCGTPHDPIKRGPSGVPRTISELKKFVDTTGISLARLHFHIDEDYRGSRAFGIYRDPKTGYFVVYKNKDTGGGGSSTRYESSYDNDSDYSYSDWGSDSGSDYDDWSSDW